MSHNHTMCAIEHFGPDPDTGGEAIRLEGWLLSNGERIRSTLVLGGVVGAEYDIEDAGRASGDVALYHGSTFGDRAAHARFLLSIPYPQEGVDWRAAAILSVFADGTTIVHEIGPSAAALEGADGAREAG